MANVYYVTTREELKRAIDSKAKYISIKNAEIANHLLVIKEASKAVIVAALVGAGVSTAMIWNPVGWLGATATAVVVGSVAVAVKYFALTLGIEPLWTLYGDYKITGQRIAKLDDGTVVEGELIICIK